MHRKDSKKAICIIRSGNVEMNANINRALYEHLASVFEDVFYVDINRVFTTAFKQRSHIGNDAYSKLPPEFKVVVPKNLSEFRIFLKSHNLVVICFFSETWEDWHVHYYMKKYAIPVIYIYAMSPMVGFRYKKIPFAWFFNKFRSRYLSIRIFRLFVLSGLFCKVDTLFSSQDVSRKDIERAKRYKDVVVINNGCYDNFLENKYEVSNDYVVFLDSMPPYHGDQLRYGYKPIDRELYYKNLNRVFDIIETVTGKETIVCLHPKYNEDNLKKDFGSRKAFKYKTDESIAKADLVLFHEASMINTAILYKKKIIQLRGSKFNDFLNRNCESYQKLFPFTTLDMYESSQEGIEKTVKSLEAKPKLYDDFLKKYIITSKQEGVSSSMQIANYISYKYGISRLEE